MARADRGITRRVLLAGGGAAPPGGVEAIVFALPGRGSPPDSMLRDLRIHDVLARVPVRIDCGDADPFAAAVRELRASLPRPPAGGMAEGCHTGPFWRRTAPAQAAFVVAHLSRVDDS